MRFILPSDAAIRSLRWSSCVQKVILVSPQAVDRYPPVQYQARLIADNGATVHLLTSPLKGRRNVHFCHPGVIIHPFPGEAGSGPIRRIALARLMARLMILRLTPPSAVLEIDYDPVGIALADLVPGRARRVVHHHHEVLLPDRASRYHRTARLALAKADLVVVADENRAGLMERADPIPKRVATVRNTPLACLAIDVPPARTSRFSLAYFGATGHSQCIDTIVASAPFWPSGVRLHVYGMPAADISGMFKAADVPDRVVMEGWVDADRLVATIARHHVAITLLRPLWNNWRYSAGASNKRFLAMAAGLPQISDNGEGVGELVVGHGVGMVIDPDDAIGLATAIATYANDPVRVETEGALGRSCIAEELNYEAEFHKVLKFAHFVD